MDLLWQDMEGAKEANSMFGCSALGGTEHEITNAEGVSVGIISGHAYSVIDVIVLKGDLREEVVLHDDDSGVKLVTEAQAKELKGDPDYEDEIQFLPAEIKLLRLRNPWGNTEWNGKWSDGSDELHDNMNVLNKWVRIQRTAGDEDCEFFEGESNDGTFLMEYSEWLEYYNNLFVCMKFPESWAGVRFKGAWNMYNSGGTPLKMTQEA